MPYKLCFLLPPSFPPAHVPTRALIWHRAAPLVELNAFIQELPRLQERNTLASKHVAVAAYLGECVDRKHLADVSEIEQELACNQDHADARKVSVPLLSS